MWISNLGMQEFKYVCCEQDSIGLWYGNATKWGSDSELCPKIENQKSCKVHNLMLRLTKEAMEKSTKSSKQDYFYQGFSKKKWNILFDLLLPKPLWSFWYFFAPQFCRETKTSHHSSENLKATEGFVLKKY